MAIRAFAALELPSVVRQRVGRLVERLARDHPRGVKWAAAETMHLTLKFFAALSEEQIGTVTGAIDEVASAFDPITLELGPLGAFPSASRPRVLWIGLVGEVETLRRLQVEFDRRLATAGFPPEERSFAAHVTLGRVREGAGPEVVDGLAALVRGKPQTEVMGFQAEELTLFQSFLRPGGSVYTRLHTTHLLGL